VHIWHLNGDHKCHCSMDFTLWCIASKRLNILSSKIEKSPNKKENASSISKDNSYLLCSLHHGTQWTGTYTCILVDFPVSITGIIQVKKPQMVRPTENLYYQFGEDRKA